jgi:hypothetical protein
MKPAYNIQWLQDLMVIKEARRWAKAGMVPPEQWRTMVQGHSVGFYHPNIIIRLLLFMATLMALGGITGFLGLGLADVGEDALAVLVLLYGLVSFLVLERQFIWASKHYKSGVTEGVLYHAIGFTIGGLAWLIDGNVPVTLLFATVVFAFSAIRFLDLVSTAGAIAALAGFVFDMLLDAGPVVRGLIPIAIMAVFAPLYFWVVALKRKDEHWPWADVLTVAETLCLLLVYAAGNYLVVRELSVELMGLALEEGEDIPLAMVFYFLTAGIPLLYLWVGIRKKDLVMLRVSLVALAFAIFTFKYYYGFLRPEVALTIAGAALLAATGWLLYFLRTPRQGYTREPLLPEKWGNEQLQAFVVSQTLGGNKPAVDPPSAGGGGESGGGGASTSF